MSGVSGTVKMPQVRRSQDGRSPVSCSQSRTSNIYHASLLRRQAGEACYAPSYWDVSGLVPHMHAPRLRKLATPQLLVSATEV